MKNSVIEEFDNYYVTVKADKLDKITACYAALGWECVSKEKHRRYFNELNLTFRRPHAISHKDERQLMQVYLDSAFNGLGKISAHPYPLTALFSVALGIACISMIVAGVLLATLLPQPAFGWGIACAVCGGLLIIPHAFLTVKLSAYEKKRNAKNAITYNAEIVKVCEAAQRLWGEPTG